jgi:hypothetical protein
MATKNAVALEVMRELGEATSNTTLVTQYEIWVQEAYDEIISEMVWPFARQTESIATVAATATVKMATNAFMPRTIRISPTDEPVDYKSREELIHAGVNMDETGRPRFWYHDSYDITNAKFVLGLWPIPDAIYSLQTTESTQGTALVTGDTVPLPREFLRILKLGIKAVAKGNEQDYAGADRDSVTFHAALTKMLIRYKNRPNEYLRLGVTDVATTDPMKPVRLPPSHFSN